MNEASRLLAVVACSILAQAVASPVFADDGERLLRLDHYVAVHSTVPSIAGQETTIYVREVVRAGNALRGKASANRMVLFVHGAGTPGAVAFDAPYQDYSWMEYLARAGFDVFAMDMTGYGRSTRPAAMNDPCNLSSEQQLELSPGGAAEPCAPSYLRQLTTIESDWNDLGAVVDHLLGLRGVRQLSLVAWSLGGPRTAGYTSQHPDKVQKLVLLAPAYSRDGGGKPAQVPASGVAMNIQSRDDLTALWNRQVGCPGQYEQPVFDAVWAAMLETDPVGSTWGPGVRRAPQVTSWGFNQAMVSGMRTPTLMVTGEHDKQVASSRVRDLYADLGASQKVLVDLACSSHNAMWEKNHLLMFKSSLEFLTKRTVNGMEQGTLRLGY